MNKLSVLSGDGPQLPTNETDFFSSAGTLANHTSYIRAPLLFSHTMDGAPTEYRSESAHIRAPLLSNHTIHGSTYDQHQDIGSIPFYIAISLETQSLFQ